MEKPTAQLTILKPSSASVFPERKYTIKVRTEGKTERRTIPVTVFIKNCSGGMAAMIFK